MELVGILCLSTCGLVALFVLFDSATRWIQTNMRKASSEPLLEGEFEQSFCIACGERLSKDIDWHILEISPDTGKPARYIKSVFCANEANHYGETRERGIRYGLQSSIVITASEYEERYGEGKKKKNKEEFVAVDISRLEVFEDDDTPTPLSDLLKRKR